MVKSQNTLPVRAMSATVAVQQQGFVLMSIAYITTEDHAHVPGLGGNLRSCWCLRVVQTWPFPPLLGALWRVEEWEGG